MYPINIYIIYSNYIINIVLITIYLVFRITVYTDYVSNRKCLMVHIASWSPIYHTWKNKIVRESTHTSTEPAPDSTHTCAQNLLRPKLQASEHGHPPHRTILHHPHHSPISPHLVTTLHCSCIFSFFCSRCMLLSSYDNTQAYQLCHEKHLRPLRSTNLCP